MVRKSNNITIFWRPAKQGKTEINTYALARFLEDLGFAQFQTDNKRTSGKEIFQNDNGILKVHNASSIKNYVRKWFESFSQGDFLKGGDFDTGTPNLESSGQFSILEAWQKFSLSQLNTLVLNDLLIFFKLYN